MKWLHATRPGPRRSAIPGLGIWAWAGMMCGAVAALVAGAPAHWLAPWVEAASDGRLRVLQARGTIWDGSARWQLTAGPGSQDAAELPDRMAWRLHAGWSGLSVELSSPCCTPQPVRLWMSPRWTGFQIRFQDSLSLWPAELLAGWGTPWNTVRLQGLLRLQTQALNLSWTSGRLQVAGRAEVEAAGLSSRLSTLRPMGSYRLVVQGGDVPTLSLQTLDGALQLTGQGQWVGRRLQFSGVASAAPERQEALGNLLNILGRRDGARTLITLG